MHGLQFARVEEILGKWVSGFPWFSVWFSTREAEVAAVDDLLGPVAGGKSADGPVRTDLGEWRRSEGSVWGSLRFFSGRMVLLCPDG